MGGRAVTLVAWPLVIDSLPADTIRCVCVDWAAGDGDDGQVAGR